MYFPETDISPEMAREAAIKDVQSLPVNGRIPLPLRCLASPTAELSYLRQHRHVLSTSRAALSIGNSPWLFGLGLLSIWGYAAPDFATFPYFVWWVLPCPFPYFVWCLLPSQTNLFLFCLMGASLLVS
jgi:hypothetical protein